MWILAALPEPEDLSDSVDHLISREDLEELAAAYDPTYRRATIIASDDGPAHFAGQFGGSLGLVRQLQFGARDEGNGEFTGLWADVASFGNSIFRAIQGGRVERSVLYAIAQPDRPGGEGPYLHHIALLGGEQPRIGGMPPLDPSRFEGDEADFVEGFEAGDTFGVPSLAASDSGLDLVCAHYPAPVPATTEEETMSGEAETPNVAATEEAPATEETNEQQSAPDPTETVAATMNDAPFDQAAVAAAIASGVRDAVAPLQAQIETLQKSVAASQNATQLDELVSQFRPGLQDGDKGARVALEKVSPENRAAVAASMLAMGGGMPVMPDNRVDDVEVDGETVAASSVLDMAAEFGIDTTSEEGMHAVAASAEHLGQLARAKAIKDPTHRRRALAEIYNAQALGGIQ